MDEYSDFMKPSMMEQGSQIQEEYVIDSYIFRKSDLDDCHEIIKILESSSKVKDGIDELYNYPKILSLLEKSYLSITILDNNAKIVGCAVFNDFP